MFRPRHGTVGRAYVALVLATLAALLVSACGVTRGEDTQGLHRLRMMVPNSPGGGYDLTARTAVKIMEDNDLTGRVEVFNVIGAGGTVAMARLMNEKGNGDLMMMMGLGVVGATYTNGSSARASDATALAKMVEEQEGILVPADSPFKTVQDLVAAWKADPAKVTIGGGSSPGGPDHLFPMETARAAGVDPSEVNYVSYDGGGDLLTAMLGKKIAAGTTGLGEFVDQIEAGQVRVLAVSGDERVEGVDAPTLTEAGIDLTFTNWRGILAPPGISEDAKTAMVKVLEELHGTDGWKEALVKNGWTDAFHDRCRVRAVPEGPGPAGLLDPDRTGADVSAPESPNAATGGDAKDVEPQQELRSTARSTSCARCWSLVGAFLIYDALSLAGGFAKVDPVGPKFFPLVIGVRFAGDGRHLGVAIARGSVGEADAGRGHRPRRAQRLAHGRPAGCDVRRHHRAGGTARLGDNGRPAVRRLPRRYWAASATYSTS